MDIEELTKQDHGCLDHLTTFDLQVRLDIVTEVLLEARAKGDVRWKNLIPQQRKLNAALVARKKAKRGEPEIAPVVVGMQPVCLTAKVQKA